MCLIVLAWRVHPDYPLVVAANRDEFHQRAAAPASWWPDHPDLLAGRDLQAGGTWLGVTRKGELAALTNYRGSPRDRPDAPSRGGLVVEMLDPASPIPERQAHLQRVAREYNGFNLIGTDGLRPFVYESVPGAERSLDPGVHGLSNHLLDTPWPKVERAKARFARALGSQPDDRAVLDLLRDDEVAPDAELPRTGVPLAWERRLSSVFIKGPDYGTRCSTFVRVAADGHVDFSEWTWDEAGNLAGHVAFHFDVSRP